MQLLKAKVAIITGSGRGIGAAAASLFAQHGAKVVVNDIDSDPAYRVAEHIQAAGGTALVSTGDLTLEGMAESLIEHTVATFGGVDVLVNNAGYTRDGMAHKMSSEQWEAMLQMHLTVPFRMIQASAPYMRGVAKTEEVPKARKIINVSSTTGTRGKVGQANYAAAKAGIIGLTKTLAKEWGPLNIQVNAVAFGMIDTRLTQAKEPENSIKRSGTQINLGIPESMRQEAKAFIPMGRPGTPEEAAGPLLFFASELSNYVSGQVLEVAGGL